MLNIIVRNFILSCFLITLLASCSTRRVTEVHHHHHSSVVNTEKLSSEPTYEVEPVANIEKYNTNVDNYSFDVDDVDDYDYYYSARIRRFHRPYRGFNYYSDVYVDYHWYDPYYAGTTIYVVHDYHRAGSYWGWNRWHRRGWNPYRPVWNRNYAWGWGHRSPWSWRNQSAYGWGWNSAYRNGYRAGYWAAYHGSNWNNFCWKSNPAPQYSRDRYYKRHTRTGSGRLAANNGYSGLDQRQNIRRSEGNIGAERMPNPRERNSSEIGSSSTTILSANQSVNSVGRAREYSGAISNNEINGNLTARRAQEGNRALDNNSQASTLQTRKEPLRNQNTNSNEHRNRRGAQAETSRRPSAQEDRQNRIKPDKKSPSYTASSQSRSIEQRSRVAVAKKPSQSYKQSSRAKAPSKSYRSSSHNNTKPRVNNSNRSKKTYHSSPRSSASRSSSNSASKKYSSSPNRSRGSKGGRRR